jgi:hypothetical protein
LRYGYEVSKNETTNYEGWVGLKSIGISKRDPLSNFDIVSGDESKFI